MTVMTTIIVRAIVRIVNEHAWSIGKAQRIAELMRLVLGSQNTSDTRLVRGTRQGTENRRTDAIGTCVSEYIGHEASERYKTRHR